VAGGSCRNLKKGILGWRPHSGLVDRALERATRISRSFAGAPPGCTGFGGELEKKRRQLLRALLPGTLGRNLDQSMVRAGDESGPAGGSYDAAMSCLSGRPKALLFCRAPCHTWLSLRQFVPTFAGAKRRRSRLMFCDGGAQRGEELGVSPDSALHVADIRGSGTTMLEHVLDAHPDIVATDETSFLFGEEAYPRLRRGFRHERARWSMCWTLHPLFALQEGPPAEYFRLGGIVSSANPSATGLLIDKKSCVGRAYSVRGANYSRENCIPCSAIRDPRDGLPELFLCWPFAAGPAEARLYLSLEATAAQ